jgi:hypothetical protein
MVPEERDEEYRELILSPLRSSADYLPKMGGGEAVDLDGFIVLYGSDPLYHWLGFDSPLMFAAHRAAGGMTSLYRQLGIGCERLVRAVLRDQLELNDEDVRWSYEFPYGGAVRLITLDGRVEVDAVRDPTARRRLIAWIKAQRESLKISVPLRGLVLEVRQGYKSADAKRQNGDLASSVQAVGHGYLPVLAIMSTQVNATVRLRYIAGRWAVLTGTAASGDAMTSTFAFMRDVVGYDVEGFFQRNAAELRLGVSQVLSELLEPK